MRSFTLMPILLAAVSTEATHLLTGDARHFGALFGRRIGGVKIVIGDKVIDATVRGRLDAMAAALCH